MQTNDYKVTFIERKPVERPRESYIYGAKNEAEAKERATDRVEQYSHLRVEVLK